MSDSKVVTKKQAETLIAEIQDLVIDLGWDFDRMSSCGQDTYTKLCTKLNIE